MRHHITRATRHLIFWSLIITAISLSGVRLALMGVNSYKANLETRVSAMLGTPVKLGSLGANMRGISPEVVIKDITIASTLATAPSAIQLKEIRLGINLGELLLSRDALASSWITLVGAKLSIIRKQDGELVVEGLKAGGGQPLWLLQGRQYEVLQSQITLRDELKEVTPLVLDPVNLAVMNDGKHHRIKLLTLLPEQVGDDITVVLDFEAEANKLSEIKGSVYFKGSNIKLPELVSAYLPFDIRMTTGAIDLKAWGQWQQAKLVSIKADAHIRQGMFARKGKGTFSVNHLDTQLGWQVKDRQWQLDINQFLLESSESNKKSSKKWPDAIISMAAEQTAGAGLQKLKIAAKQLDLTEASKLLRFFAPLTEEQANIVDQSQVGGLLRDFSLFAEPNTKSFAVAGRFDSLKVEPLLSLPGIESLSGQVKGSDTLGAVELNAQATHLKAPQLFDKPLMLDKLQGILTWQQSEAHLLLSTQSLILDCPALKSETRLLVKLPKNDESPFMDLQTALTSNDISQLKTFIPTKIMKPIIRAWLEPAFVAGKITKGDVLFYGKTSDFPFANGTGVLEAMVAVDKLEMNFNPEWPHISGVNGRISYANRDIIGLFHGGKIGKATIIKAEASIPQLGNNEEHVNIKGQAEGDISEALDVLQHSPLANRVSQLIKATTTQGAANVNLDLSIPLWDGQELKADGNVNLKNAQLTVKQLALKVDSINGGLRFTKNGIYADAIKATALGQPIQINITQADQQTLINVAGSTTVSDIDKLFGWPQSQIAEGESTYQLQLQLPSSQVDDPVLVNVKSDLEGVSLQLPGTLSKTKAQRKPTSVTVNLGDEFALPIELDYNNELKAAINLNPNGQIINSGHVLIGTGNAKQTKVPGIKLEIKGEQLALQDWLGVAASQQSNMPAINVNEVKIQSPSALLNKTRLGAFELTLKRNASFWSGDIDSAIARGKIQLPIDAKGVSPVIMDMEMLNLTALKQLKMQEEPSAKTEFKPLLNIKSKKTLWKIEDLGEMVLETERTPKGMNIKRLELKGDDEKLVAKGNWREIGNSSVTRLKGSLEMEKADKLFDKLNITKDFTNTSGAIDFNLNWDATPWQPSVSSLRGTMDIKLKSGRILSIEPGFGRVLGILAVAQWIKRLQLDFGDIYQEGLTFNSIEGHFDLLNGKAATKDLFIDAVPAKITITGDTDLVNQTVDHVIKVVPKSLDAVPIAGTIVSRIAAMVGKTLTGEDQEGFFFGTNYLVKGNWDDVKVSSQHENDGLFQKTWNGITDFPWQNQKK